MPYELKQKLEEQKRSVAAIDGEAPWIALGCVASFPQRAGGMRVDAFDPKKDAIEAISLEISRDQFMLAYYLPFLRALELGDQTDGGELFETATFANFGLRLRIPRLLTERIRSAESGNVTSLYPDVLAMLDDILSRERDLLPDGVSVETDWQDVMSLSDWELPG